MNKNLKTHKLANLLKEMSQADAIYKFLEEGNELSKLEAKENGICYLSQVVSRLRSEGAQIYLNTRKSKDGSMIRSYYLSQYKNNPYASWYTSSDD